ncbi:MAG TPA: hypothetical protein VFX06_12345 [Stellaceae bacterium]|nr:hypothetical protein [Stellaceae bacterium]
MPIGNFLATQSRKHLTVNAKKTVTSRFDRVSAKVHGLTDGQSRQLDLLEARYES